MDVLSSVSSWQIQRVSSQVSSLFVSHKGYLVCGEDIRNVHNVCKY